MSSIDRRALLLILPAALAACGFTPVYAPGGTAGTLRDRVEIAAPDSTESYLLVQNLEERLGRSASPDYRLGLALATASQGLAITPANEITRYTITGVADYTLTRIGEEGVVASGQVRNFTGYSATGTTVDTLAAERDARARLMQMLADQITAQLYATADLDA